jgi:protein MpaA
VVDTRIVGRPAKATFSRRLEFRLRLRGAGDGPVSLECALDGRRFAPCSRRYRTGRLGYGAHRVRARAVLDEGRDPSPAVHRFSVERRRITFGHSVAGRALRAYRIGDPEARRKALVVGSIHGDETEGHEIVGRVRRELREISRVEIWVVQTVNPDGAARNTRKNAHGVDLNRNFGEDWNGSAPPSSADYAGPHPFSEPESRAVRRLVKRVRPDVTVWYHQPWNAVLSPCSGPSSTQREYARVAGMRTSCRGAGLPGTVRNWQNANFGGHAFVVELGGGELGSNAVRRHARAVARVSRPG